jgi:hypothetical protein
MERQLRRHHTIDRIGNPKCITDFCRRFFISNSRQFRQLRKLSSIQCRNSLVVKNGLGGSGTHDLNSSAAFVLSFFLSISSSLYYFHSYAVALNFWDSGSVSKSSAIIRLFIQDNFCEFVNPVIMVNPLNFPPFTTLVFS